MAKAKKPNRTKRAPKKAAPRQRSATDWALRFLDGVAATANIGAACVAAGIGRMTVYDRRDADPEFAAALAVALDCACDDLELEARRRAKDGVTRPIFGSGGVGVGTVQVGEVQEYSDTLMIFLLKAHRPEKYRENVKVTHGGTLRHEFDDLSDADLDARIQQTEARLAEAAPRPTRPARPR